MADPLTMFFYYAVLPAGLLAGALVVRAARRLSDLDKGVIALLLIGGGLVMWSISP